MPLLILVHHTLKHRHRRTYNQSSANIMSSSDLTANVLELINNRMSSQQNAAQAAKSTTTAAPGTSHAMAKKSSAGDKEQIAGEFKKQLDSILVDHKSHSTGVSVTISKEKMNQLVREAIKSHKFYKHIVYYVESFIKNVFILFLF